MPDAEPHPAPSSTPRSVGRFEGWYGVAYNRIMRRDWLRRTAFAALGGSPALRELPEMFARIVDEHPEDGRLLDVPCGEGLVERLLVAHGWSGAATALDLAARAVERTSALSVDYDLEVIRGSALDMPFDDASFATVISFNGLHVMPDHAQFLRELARVVAPDGSIWLTTIVSGPGVRRRGLIRGVRTLGVVPVEPPTEAELLTMTEAAGLRVREHLGGTTVVALRLERTPVVNATAERG